MKKLLLACVAVALSAGVYSAEVTAANLPETAVKIEADGLDNFYRVSQELYRGEQPEENGFETLAEMGIKTVVNFRESDDSEEKAKVESLGMRYIPIPIKTWNFKEKHAIEFINIMKEQNNAPVFIHCRHGADRTGTMAAVYRIIFQNWTKKAAREEMVNGGFGHHKIWKNLPRFIKKMDVEKLKKIAGEK